VLVPVVEITISDKEVRKVSLPAVCATPEGFTQFNRFEKNTPKLAAKLKLSSQKTGRRKRRSLSRLRRKSAGIRPQGVRSQANAEQLDALMEKHGRYCRCSLVADED
jgi:hypothetical protein